MTIKVFLASGGSDHRLRKYLTVSFLQTMGFELVDNPEEADAITFFAGPIWRQEADGRITFAVHPHLLPNDPEQIYAYYPPSKVVLIVSDERAIAGWISMGFNAVPNANEQVSTIKKIANQ